MQQRRAALEIVSFLVRKRVERDILTATQRNARPRLRRDPSSFAFKGAWVEVCHGMLKECERGKQKNPNAGEKKEGRRRYRS